MACALDLISCSWCFLFDMTRQNFAFQGFHHRKKDEVHYYTFVQHIDQILERSQGILHIKRMLQARRKEHCFYAEQAVASQLQSSNDIFDLSMEI